LVYRTVGQKVDLWAAAMAEQSVDQKVVWRVGMMAAALAVPMAAYWAVY
jgi:hypothetical protein